MRPVSGLRRTTIAPTRLAPLDGVRAIAVLVVMAYHSGIPGLRVGGFYGQDAFFVLSGLLITSLLLREGAGRGGVDLVGFWGRRARRLLPALLLVLLAVDVYVSSFAPRGRYPGFTGDALSALFYVSNWHLLATRSDYFAATGTPSLLTHTWSLGIEEQFYLAWPLVVLALLLAGRWLRRPRAVTPAVLVLSAAGALASAGWMARLSTGGASSSRLYYGTDTHAQCLLVGAAVGAGLSLIVGRQQRSALFPAVTAIWPRRGLTLVGLLGAAGLGAVWTQLPNNSAFAYRGGFLVVAVSTAAVLVSVGCVPAGALARTLGLRPLAFVGRISYGMYLWYFPVFAVVSGSSTGLRSWALFSVRVAVVLALATISWYAVERPLQTGRVLRIDPRSWSGRLQPATAAGVALVATCAVLLVSTGDIGRGSDRVTVAAAAFHPATAQAARAAAGPPTHVLLVGDSTAFTLGFSLGDTALEESYHYQLDAAGIRGCGVAISARLRVDGEPATIVPPCSADAPASEQWPALLAQEIRADRPDVVLLAAGRWEVYDREPTPGAGYQDITRPADAAYVDQQLERAVAIGSARGAHVVLATAPCFSSGELPDGGPRPEDDPARLAAYNSLVRQVAATHPQAVSVLDLDALVCPGGHFVQSLDGVTVRAPDGIHYPFFDVVDSAAAKPDTRAQTLSFGQWLMPRIAPVLLARH